MELLQYTASLPGGSGQWTSCNKVPQCLGAVGSGPPAIHCLTASGQWAVQLLQYTTPLPGGSGQGTSCNTLPHCLGAVGSGPPAIHCPTAWGQWAVDLLQYTAPLPRGSGQWTSCNTLPHCLRAVGSGPPATHCLTAWEQWAVDLLQYTAPLPGGSGHRSTASGQWVVDLLCHVVWCGVLGYRVIGLAVLLVEWFVGCLVDWVVWQLGLFCGYLAGRGMLYGACTLCCVVPCVVAFSVMACLWVHMYFISFS